MDEDDRQRHAADRSGRNINPAIGSPKARFFYAKKLRSTASAHLSLSVRKTAQRIGVPA
ncbi:hypothetical protein ACFQFS_13860 [Novosphingobium lubricantis]